MKRKGFTLAEVLVTLLVIGVVAALTIPTLLQSQDSSRDKTAYKKAFSTLANAAKLMDASDIECKITDNASLAACFANNSIRGTIGSGNNDNVITTSDGMSYAFYYDHNYNDDGYAPTDKTIKDACGTKKDNDDHLLWRCVVVVDLNGLNKGRKVFPSWIASESSSAAVGVFSKDQQGIIVVADGAIPVYINGNPEANIGYHYLMGGKETTSSNDSYSPVYYSPVYYSPVYYSPVYYSPTYYSPTYY